MRPSFFGTIAGGVSFDPDAEAFITAAGITDPTQQGAIDTLVIGLKADSLWTEFYAIYPFVGGSASAHKYNLKDPRDLDAAYRIVFNGGFAHNANGITPDGLAGTYADTKLNGSSVLDKNDSHYSFYSRTNSDAGQSDFGGTNTQEVYTRLTNLYYNDIPNATDRTSGANTDSRGLFNGSLGASSTVIYRNGVSLYFGGAAGTNYTNNTLVFCNGGAGLSLPSARNLAFGSIGTSFTAGQAANFYTNVQAFQTTLGRQV